MKNADDEILNERYNQMRESANSYIETLARDHGLHITPWSCESCPECGSDLSPCYYVDEWGREYCEECLEDEIDRYSLKESLDSRAERLNDYIDSYYEAKELGEEAGWQKREYKSLLQTIKREFGPEIYQAVANDTPELAFKILRKQSK